MAGEKSFDCRKCGQCCEGSGGIVLSAYDIVRLASFLAKSTGQFIEDYAETANKKIRLKTSENGFCVFFRSGIGCDVHEAKPDICRAWPWFRGNMEDEASFFMARDFCPGISRTTSHQEFICEGKKYLNEHHLADNIDNGSANSILPSDWEH